MLESCLTLQEKIILLLDLYNFDDESLEIVTHLSSCLALAESAVITISSGAGSFIKSTTVESRLQMLLCAYCKVEIHPFQKLEGIAMGFL